MHAFYVVVKCMCILKIINICDSKAETIEKAILSYLEQVNIKVSNITSFGSDGAAVMTGPVSRVAARLKQLNPEMTSVHSINHRFALLHISLEGPGRTRKGIRL